MTKQRPALRLTPRGQTPRFVQRLQHLRRKDLMKALESRDLHAPPSSPAHMRLVADLNDAARTLGAFAVRPDPALAAAAEELLALARMFFALPPDVKAKYACTEQNPRGYHAVPSAGDVREKFLVTQLGPQTETGPLAGANLDVADLPDFAERLEAAVATVAATGVALLTALAPSLGLDRRVVAQAFEPPGGAAAWLLHYPPVAPVDGRPGQGTSSHRDLHPLALIVQDEHGGLDIHDGTRWVQADPQQFRVVCQMGDAMALWSGGQTVANVHRVRSPAATSRYSVAVFLQPAPGTLLGPPPATTFEALMQAWFNGLADGTTGYADVG